MKGKNKIFIENSLVPWLGKTKSLIDNKMEDIFVENKIDLSRIQFVVLKNIEQNNGISQKELAFFSNKNKSSLARMIATLERKDYILKEYCENDKRRCKINISSKGSEVLTKAAPFLQQFVHQLEDGISDQEKKQIKQILNKIQNNIIGDGPSPFFKEKK